MTFGTCCGAVKDDPEIPCIPADQLANDFCTPTHYCWVCIPFARSEHSHPGECHECECGYSWPNPL